MVQQQWEHKLVIENGTNIQYELNRLGKDGWEAVGFYYYGGYTVLIKRLVQEQTKQEGRKDI